MLTIRAMSNGTGYAANHLVHSDYYAEERRVVGHWQGRGAAELGLVGEVTEEQFEAMRQGLHPATGEQLRPRQSADRLSLSRNPGNVMLSDARAFAHRAREDSRQRTNTAGRKLFERYSQLVRYLDASGPVGAAR